MYRRIILRMTEDVAALIHEKSTWAVWRCAVPNHDIFCCQRGGSTGLVSLWIELLKGLDVTTHLDITKNLVYAHLFIIIMYLLQEVVPRPLTPCQPRSQWFDFQNKCKSWENIADILDRSRASQIEGNCRSTTNLGTVEIETREHIRGKYECNYYRENY